MGNGDIYRKTAQGIDEIRTRRAGLDARSRTLLILANGELGVGALSERMGTDVQPWLAELARQGLLERVPARPPRPAVAATESSPAASPPPTTAPSSAPSKPDAMAPAAVPITAPPGGPTPSNRPERPDTAPDAAHAAQALAAAKSRVMPLLEPLFGPNALDMARPLLAAPSRRQYLDAVRELTETVAIYRGKKGAAKLVQPLLEGI